MMDRLLVESGDRKTHGGNGTFGDNAGFLGKHVLYVVNVDSFFLSHRLPLARAMRDAGARVSVAAADTGKTAEIREQGFAFYPLQLSRTGMQLNLELKSLQQLVRLYRQLRPDLVHHVTVKCVAYGSLAARLTPGTAVVNALSGLGFLFSDHPRAKFVRPFLRPLFKAALGHPRSRTIFQNEENLQLFIENRLISADDTVLIRGSGVDCDEYFPGDSAEDPPVVLLSSRLLWDKGVGEFVEAARQIKRDSPRVRFVLVGTADDNNPTAVSSGQLESWVQEGVVEWWGHRNDMPEVLRSASILVLPSRYLEGVPKALIEGAATGLPLVATDTPGCRDIVRNDYNGILVPPGDATAVASAISRLLADPALRLEMGQNGRILVLNEFSVDLVVEQTLSIYSGLLS